MTPPTPSVDQLARVQAEVRPLITGIRDDQWSTPTPCTEWNVREVVTHLVGLNKVFAATLNDQPMPQRGADPLGADPFETYRESEKAVLAAFDQPGILARSYTSPLGTTTGAGRLNWRIADLLSHAWDLGQALDRPVTLSDDIVEHAISFVRADLQPEQRGVRFRPAQSVADDAPAIDRLVAFLGRPVRTVA
jgi:uncharacterized protein (TIGR03086 family)